MGSWDFGDGQTAEGFEVSHTYSEVGTYTVTFTATNQKRRKKGSDMAELQVDVQPPIRAASIVSITFEPRSPDTQSSVRFTANVRDDDREVTGYSWSFGDGAESTDAQPEHTFSEAGTYTVRLRATNSAGSDNRTVSVTVVPYEAEICKELADLNPAFFDRNSSTLSDDGKGALQDNLDVLTQCPNTCVTLAGYAAPGERRPMELSTARANAVQGFYVDGGMPPGRLSVEGRGRVEGVSRKEAASQFRRVDSLPNRCSDM
jgi:PKD repeat protein